MKLQIEGQQLRVRINEDELSQLLAGDALEAATRFARAFAIRFTLRLSAQDEAGFSGVADAWQITLPDVAVREHAARLPTREGLRFVLTGERAQDALVLLFDVDVRDSVRRRRAEP